MDTFLVDIPIPSMGATVNEIMVIDILVAPGTKFTKGQKLAEFESDKSAFDFEAPCDGALVQVFCRAGDMVPVNQPFMRVETSDASLKHLKVQAAMAQTTAAPQPQVPVVRSVPPLVPKVPSAPLPSSSPPPAPPTARVASPARPAWTPRALKIAQDAGLAPEQLTDVPATGPGGRVSGDDIERYLASRPPASGGATPARDAATKPATGGFDPKLAETVCVAGIGYAVPRNVRLNEEILKAFPEKTPEEIVRITGIRQRHYAGPNESVTSLAKIAVNHALSMSGANLSEIDGIIMATLIPDQPVPSAASALARELGLMHALAFDINAACSGWLYALEIGRAMIRAGTARKLIVVTGELLSRITNPKDYSTAFLFGDGAGAAILTDDAGGHRLNRMHLAGDAEHYECIQRAGGGAREPLPEPGASLDRFYLQMDGSAVFKHGVYGFARMIEETLQRHGLKPEDVSWIVPHQANERILRAVSKRVGIAYEKFVVTIGKYGNTSAASVSMALGWAAEEGIFSRGDKIVFCSVGAGLTFAGGLLTW
jgi:3-oxoacyl-(acyl-carrier-protein) synthase III